MICLLCMSCFKGITQRKISSESFTSLRLDLDRVCANLPEVLALNVTRNSENQSNCSHKWVGTETRQNFGAKTAKVIIFLISKPDLISMKEKLFIKILWKKI